MTEKSPVSNQPARQRKNADGSLTVQNVAINRAGILSHAYEYVKSQFVLGTTPSPVSIPPGQNGTMVKAGLMKWEMYEGKYCLLSDITSCRSCSGVARGCVNRIRLWPLRRDHHLGVLIGKRACWLMT